MATSGTTGLVTLDVAQIIEHAFRRATGGLTSSISAEQMETARENLGLGLSNFASKGLSLWCVKKRIFTAVAGVRTYAMGPGVQDLLQLLRRDGTFTDADSVASALAELTYASATAVDAAILELPAGTATWLLESSDDGSAWTERGSYSGTLTAATTVTIDTDTVVSAVYWRASQSVGADVPTGARFVNGSREIEMTQIGRDTYNSLPNKFTTGTPVQYVYDKQYSGPLLTVWQVPATANYQFVAVVQESVEDVGAFTNNLAVPTRWLDAIIFDLTVRTFIELPKQMTNEKLTLSELREMAREKLDEAANSETDGAPMFIQPNIAAYTR